MKLYHCHSIEWDTESDGKVYSPKSCGSHFVIDRNHNKVKKRGLPTEVFVIAQDDTDIAENGADLLSDKYGFCVYGFLFDEIPNVVEE